MSRARGAQCTTQRTVQVRVRIVVSTAPAHPVIQTCEAPVGLCVHVPLRYHARTRALPPCARRYSLNTARCATCHPPPAHPR
jgi:hypothetical protein